jgi:hypothetical protein
VGLLHVTPTQLTPVNAVELVLADIPSQHHASSRKSDQPRFCGDF